MAYPVVAVGPTALPGICGAGMEHSSKVLFSQNMDTVEPDQPYTMICVAVKFICKQSADGPVATTSYTLFAGSRICSPQGSTWSVRGAGKSCCILRRSVYSKFLCSFIGSFSTVPTVPQAVCIRVALAQRALRRSGLMGFGLSRRRRNPATASAGGPDLKKFLYLWT